MAKSEGVSSCLTSWKIKPNKPPRIARQGGREGCGVATSIVYDLGVSLHIPFCSLCLCVLSVLVHVLVVCEPGLPRHQWLQCRGGDRRACHGHSQTF